jgi:hypothetical protein
MSVGPYSQDVLTRIYNVSWGGAVFVIGDDNGFIWYCNATETSDPTKLIFEKVGQIGPQSDDSISFAPPGNFQGGSYALVADKSVYLLCGFQFKRTTLGELYTNGVIMRSEDGRQWATVFDKDSTLTSERWEARKLVRDELTGTFYCWMIHTTAVVPGQNTSQDSQCWSSTDGRGWGQGSSVPGNVLNPEFESHCKFKWTPEGKDGQGYADGEFGFNPGIEELQAGQKGRIVTDPVTGKNGQIVALEDLAGTNGVAFAKGIWGRGDSNEQELWGTFEISVDNAATWKFVAQVFQYSENIVGQPTRIGTVIAGS